MAVSARIQQIYLALFGRPADPVGGEYYDTLTHDGADLSAILTGSSRLSGSAEYLDRFAGMNNTQIIETIYQSLFGHPADLAGLTFYTQAMANGDAQMNGQPLPFPGVPAYTIEQIAVGILDGATGTDADIIANKTDAAVEFTDSLDTPAEIAAYQGDNAADFGRDFINGVTADPGSVPTQSEVDSALNDLVGNVANGLSVNLTGDIDTVTTNPSDPLHSSAANDVIRGIVNGNPFTGSSTFNDGDSINGGEGYDKVEITNLTTFVFGPPVVNVIADLNNVEELSVRNLGGIALELDASSWDASLKAVTLHDSFNPSQGLMIDGLKSNVDFNFDDTTGYIQVDYATGALGANATVDVNMANAESTLRLYHDDSDTITTLHVDSTGIANNDGWNNLSYYDEAGNHDLTKVVVTGDSALQLYIDDQDHLAMFDASANTGGVDVDLDGVDVDLTVKGSSNDDYIELSLDNGHVTTLTAGAGDDNVQINDIANDDSLDGGDGYDTLEFNDYQDAETASANSTFEGTFKNFEQIAIDSIYGNITVDMHNLDDISDVAVDYNDGYTLTLNNFQNNGTLSFWDTSYGTTDVHLASDSSNDTLHINTNAYYVGTIGVTNIENLVIDTGDYDSTAEDIYFTNDGNVKSVTLTGVEGLDFNNGGNVFANLVSFDGSGVTGEGTDGAIRLETTSTNDLTVKTGAGDDYLYLSGGGDDTITTNDGADTVWALGGNDTVDLGAGDDFVSGGDGADTLTGGAGSDEFHYDFVSESQGVNTDTITDFVSGTDTIYLDGLTSNFTFLGNAAGSAAALSALVNDGDSHAVFDSVNHDLLIDINGDGVIDNNDMTIHLTGLASMQSTDFDGV